MIHLDQIQRGAREMSALIDGLLALSRVSHVEMRREAASLDELVKRAIEPASSRRARERVDRMADRALPAVRCDPELMQQVFANLIDNAVKYTRPRPHAR